MIDRLRLNKYLAMAGVCSRREADEHISAGEVSVNGAVVKELGYIVNPETDFVVYRHKPIKIETDLVYYALNKPKNIVSSSANQDERRSVVDLVPKKPRVFPVGRLDVDSEGLILLTNDGDFANILMHPKYSHQKEYQVYIQREGNKKYDFDQIKRRLISGFIIDGKEMKADSVSDFHLHHRDNQISFRIILHTGLNRQIRRMCSKIGLMVERLVRTRIVKLELDKLGLEPGAYKKVKKDEVL